MSVIFDVEFPTFVESIVDVIVYPVCNYVTFEGESLTIKL